MPRFLAKQWLVFLCPMLILACASPAQRVDKQAERLGFSRSVVKGTEFQHVIYRNVPSRASTNLHVYIEGDGTPWLGRRWVSPDPTPRNPLVLKLMALEEGPSVYLGRPCYFGQASHHPCSALFWTHARYSERVVESMARSLSELLNREGYRSLTLIGHSGGGTLAMLLAERFPQTHAVITLAGNLDVEAWAVHHGYSRLEGSLNPANRALLNPAVLQLHLVGDRDRNVTPALVTRAIAEHPRALLTVIEGYDHTCCWMDIWPQVLACLVDSPKKAEGQCAIFTNEF